MAAEGSDPITDDELVYRRVPESTGWYADGELDPAAFNPRPDDTTGISVSRAKYNTIEDAAKGRPGKRYLIAVSRAGDLRQSGIEIRPDPLPDDPGHAEITSLNYANRKTSLAGRQMFMLAGPLCLRVEGPFDTPERET